MKINSVKNQLLMLFFILGSCVFNSLLAQGTTKTAEQWIAIAKSGKKDLANANLIGANLSQVNLSGVDLSGANLSGANLSNAILTDCNFYKTNLTGANLSGATLTRASFLSTNMPYVNLKGANMEQTLLQVRISFGGGGQVDPNS
jgi:uncharacterized protein YjbI with pentapeptide repeats